MKAAYKSNGVRIFCGDALETLRKMPSDFFHCCVTSPPYWGQRDYKVKGQMGLEESPQEYIDGMVEVFREVHRTLRADGTLWLNIGDSYAGGGRAGKNPEYHAKHTMFGKTHDSIKFGLPMKVPQGLKPKDLVGIPWMLAFALRGAGWYLRCDIIWSKTNGAPLSVRDRPTTSHEYMFLFSKSRRYFYDIDAVREPHAAPPKKGGTSAMRGQAEIRPRGNLQNPDRYYNPLGRNRRSVWTMAVSSYRGSHFATFPSELVRIPILAGTSAEGCCKQCGAPACRLTRRTRLMDGEPLPLEYQGGWKGNKHQRIGAQGVGHWKFSTKVETIGWDTGCDHEEGLRKCVVLDPFMGAGTTAMVARELGRRCVGIELSPSSVELTRKRLDGD